MLNMTHCSINFDCQTNRIIRWIDFKTRKKNKMPANEAWNEVLVEKRVTYSLEVAGRFVIIGDVPARVNVETGEKHFFPRNC